MLTSKCVAQQICQTLALDNHRKRAKLGSMLCKSRKSAQLHDLGDVLYRNAGNTHVSKSNDIRDRKLASSWQTIVPNVLA